MAFRTSLAGHQGLDDTVRVATIPVSPSQPSKRCLKWSAALIRRSVQGRARMALGARGAIRSTLPPIPPKVSPLPRVCSDFQGQTEGSVPLALVNEGAEMNVRKAAPFPGAQGTPWKRPSPFSLRRAPGK